MTQIFRRASLAATLALLAAPLAAHVPPESHGALLAGATHPLFGLDHVIAMLAIGVWAMQIGGRGVWAVPAGFVGAMAFGYIAATLGAPLFAVEPMILASSIVIGVAVVLALNISPVGAIGVAAFFGLFHGHAHGAELGTAAALPFGIGFIVVTAALHALGIVMAHYMARAHPLAPRFLGAVSTALGLSLVLG